MNIERRRGVKYLKNDDYGKNGELKQSYTFCNSFPLFKKLQLSFKFSWAFLISQMSCDSIRALKHDNNYSSVAIN